MTICKKKRYIGEPLKRALNDNNVQAVELADALGISKSMVYQYISNQKYPSSKRLNQIADYLVLPVEYFTGETQDFNKVNDTLFLDMSSSDLTDFQILQYKDILIKRFNYIFNTLDKKERVNLIVNGFKLLDLSSINESKGDAVLNTTDIYKDRHNAVYANDTMSHGLNQHLQTMIDLNRQQVELLNQLIKGGDAQNESYTQK